MLTSPMAWGAIALLVAAGVALALWYRRGPHDTTCTTTEFDGTFVARDGSETKESATADQPTPEAEAPDPNDNHRSTTPSVHTVGATTTADQPSNPIGTDAAPPEQAAPEAPTQATISHGDIEQASGPISLPRGGTGATWTQQGDTGAVAMGGLWLEQTQDRGEDASPTLLTAKEQPIGLIGVYDGTGGAGAGLAGVGNDGAAHTGAWLASRAVRAATEAWFADELVRSGSEEFTDTLRTALHDRLSEEMHQVAGSSRLAGTLRRDLPTTMAVAAYRTRRDSSFDVVAMWVGDSRVFVLTHQSGLQQLTRDDSPAVDALGALIDDPPMNNVISAKGDFFVNARRLKMSGPAVVLAATDGCFGYVATPAHFELMVLRALSTSDSREVWMRTLLDSIDAITSDDASLAAVDIGFTDFEQLQNSFAPRLDDLWTEHWLPYEGVDHTERSQLVAFRQKSWDSYRNGYEALLEPRT